MEYVLYRNSFVLFSYLFFPTCYSFSLPSPFPPLIPFPPHLTSPHLPMPVVVKDFEWSETDSQVHIQVPLRGVPPKKVDIYGMPEWVVVCAQQT